MTSQLDNLVAIGQLKREAADQREFAGLVHSGRMRLKDSHVEGLSLEGRFDLAYNAAHALSLAALRRRGYRSDNGISSFSASRTRLRSGRKSGESCPIVTGCAIAGSMKANWILASSWLPI
jgi:hypothetical protein